LPLKKEEENVLEVWDWFRLSDGKEGNEFSTALRLKVICLGPPIRSPAIPYGSHLLV